MILFIVDAGMDETLIHRVDWENGKYMGLKRIKGNINVQATDLIWMMKRDRCTKIVFDNMGIGRGLEEQFRWHARHPDNGMFVDEKGKVTHLTQPHSRLDGEIL